MLIGATTFVVGVANQHGNHAHALSADFQKTPFIQWIIGLSFIESLTFAADDERYSFVYLIVPLASSRKEAHR